MYIINIMLYSCLYFVGFCINGMWTPYVYSSLISNYQRKIIKWPQNESGFEFDVYHCEYAFILQENTSDLQGHCFVEWN